LNLILFLATITISLIAVRIGAIAFELTGLRWDVAKFQAISCFTGTGFTTREAEMVTNHPQRRQIASVLMVLGNAGLVTIIATFANSMRPGKLAFDLPFTDAVFPEHLLPWVNLLIIIIFLYMAYRVLTKTELPSKFTDIIRRKMAKDYVAKPFTFEELRIVTGGYGVSRIELHDDTPMINQTIMESDIRNHDINILAVERNHQVTPNPNPNFKILKGDILICFGKLNEMRNTFSPAKI